jgi:deferrochelatase/peroxidase EfeB
LRNLPLERVLLDTQDAERGSSFLVYRKLRQDVGAFREFEQKLAEAAANAGMDRFEAGRLLVGRTRDGLPLAALDRGMQSPAGLDLNAFDFAADTSDQRCPFHAHTRKANPRSLVGRTGRANDIEVATQIVRRGVVYNSDGRTTYDPSDPPPADTGLLFMAYMADIYSQFEVMQANWFSQPVTRSGQATQRDPLLYGGAHCPVWEWGDLSVPLPRLVTPLGGAYLFVPSRAWLRDPPLAASSPT